MRKKPYDPELRKAAIWMVTEVGLSPHRTAFIMGISRSTICRWLDEDVNPKFVLTDEQIQTFRAYLRVPQQTAKKLKSQTVISLDSVRGGKFEK